MLKEYLSGGDRPNFLYPRFLFNYLKRLLVTDGPPCLYACLSDGSAVDQFKKQFSHLEGGGTVPPERQHTSLPRWFLNMYLFFISDHECL